MDAVTLERTLAELRPLIVSRYRSKPRLVGATAAGYQDVTPLSATELAVVEPLVRTRLATSLVMQAHERTRQPGNDYLLVSQADAWRVLQILVGAEGPQRS